MQILIIELFPFLMGFFHRFRKNLLIWLPRASFNNTNEKKNYRKDLGTQVIFLFLYVLFKKKKILRDIREKYVMQLLCYGKRMFVQKKEELKF